MNDPTAPSDSAAPPPTSRAWRHFLIPGVIALVGYVVLYGVDSRLRTTRGPWEITFVEAPDKPPAIVIAQPALGISNVTVRFPGETLPDGPERSLTVRFDRPRMEVPFGKTSFDDLMYLPGTVVLHCFGHEVQMLPRALFLDRKEQVWESNRTYEPRSEEKLPTLDPPKRTSRLRRAN